MALPSLFNHPQNTISALNKIEAFIEISFTQPVRRFTPVFWRVKFEILILRTKWMFIISNGVNISIYFEWSLKFIEILCPQFILAGQGNVFKRFLSNFQGKHSGISMFDMAALY
jgi:hypothetical protein